MEEPFDDVLTEMVQAAPNAILAVDRRGTITRANPAADAMFGYETGELAGRSVEELVPAELRGRHVRHREAFTAAPEARPMGRNRDLRARRRDGSEFPVEISLGPAREGTTMVFIADITERKRLETELALQALHDPLTGLANRTLFFDRLEHALRLAQRDGTRVAVLLIDLDRFKVINDSLGHEAGDELLVQLTPLLRGATRRSDTVARLGGDEFAIVCRPVDGEHQARLLAERIASAWSRPFTIAGREVYVTASVGIAVSGEPAEDAPALLRQADAAMYRAKDTTPGGYEVFDDLMRARALSQLRAEGALRRALRDGAIDVAYQPVVDLASGRTVAVEALARWDDPERGPVPPSEFVRMAEDLGLAKTLGDLVLDRAAEQVARWQHDAPPGEPPLCLSLNVSAGQLADGRFVADLGEAMRRHGLAPESVIVEITEPVLLRGAFVHDLIEDLRARGVHVALDDFGVGYSSLGFLRRYDIDTLKIDRSFVADLLTGEEGEALVGAVIAMARALGLTVVAEGVETRAQESALRRLGCHQAQGFLYAQAEHARGLEHRVTARRRV